MQKSIVGKVKLITSVLLLITVIVIATINIIKLSTFSKDKATKDAININKQITHSVIVELYNSYYAAYNLAIYLKGLKENGVILSRDAVIDMLVQNVAVNKNTFGSCTMWEPNAYDNNDQKFVNSMYHDYSGRFLPYAYKNTGGGVSIEPIVNYEVDNSNNEWYYKPKKLKRAILSEPYFYPVDGGKRNIYMVTITIPIIVDNQFVGVITADTEIDFIQNLIDKIQTEYETTGILIISPSGIIVGNRGNKATINKNIAEVLDNKLATTILKSDKNVVEDNDFIYSINKLKIGEIEDQYIVVTKINKAEIYSERNNSILLIAILSIIIIGLGYYIINAMIITMLKPIKDVEEYIENLKDGNVKYRLNYETEDEFGVMITKLNQFAEYLENEINYNIQQLAKGNIEIDFRQKSHKDAITPNFIQLRNSIKALVDEINKLILAAQQGNLNERGNIQIFEGSFKEIIQGFNQALDLINNPLKESSKVLEVMASGDFRVMIDKKFNGEFEKLANSINHLINSVNQIVNEIKLAVSTNASSSAEISSSIEEMSAGLNSQANQIKNIAISIEEIYNSITKSSEDAEKAMKSSQVAVEQAIEGGKVVQQVINGMNNISIVVDNSANKIFKLGESSEKIGEIIQVIDEIADQTNLLALNAAIEAARAGEQGRGFAVVADEVRKLAERTGKATKEIAEMIKQIQIDTQDAVVSMKQGITEVDNGKNLVHIAEEILNVIIDANKNLTQMISAIALAAEQEAGKAQVIYNNIDEINKISNEAALGINQISRAADDLNRLSDNLMNIIQKFKTN
ncbi:MAG TPA: methyl-accepting chemotaxis protein [Ignavibacteriales bacterium]|nr:methyl-accepting chemotaxis protein [Ignavibacteriales bacterium]HOL80394.1 methyl-accepting chemotaxis protein [Ignavibacteriales bacterium]HOM64845.1 methyl-accepting chemotaxis protein [Ignavibacteriales bacterium]HPD67422.1 methyl-accepting chemotaxis protein [Ignavibacteriales bacterium]HPP32583.1 methyl-accepting chemotaxis protein [Ignavibacteriales bacterium]